LPLSVTARSFGTRQRESGRERAAFDLKHIARPAVTGVALE